MFLVLAGRLYQTNLQAFADRISSEHMQPCMCAHVRSVGPGPHQASYKLSGRHFLTESISSYPLRSGSSHYF